MDSPATHRRASVVIRVDATQRSGVGHLVRQLALAEELLARGHRVRLLGVSDVDWALRQVAERGLVLQDPPADPDALARRLASDGVDVVVIDGYGIGPQVGRALRTAGIGVLALVDAEFGLRQEADVYVDQNLGAVAAPQSHPDADFLVGLDFVLLRDVVLDRRGAERPRTDDPDAPPRVLVVFGGTDPYGGCAVLVPLLLATGLPVEVVAIAARREVADRLAALECGRGQSVAVLPTADDLPGLAAGCDAAVSASGTTVWEFLCLGVPLGLVCVTDNQRLGYRAATKGPCLAVGELEALKSDEAARAASVVQLARLVGDSALRADLARRGRALVDGRGRERVADAVERLALR